MSDERLTIERITDLKVELNKHIQDYAREYHGESVIVKDWSLHFELLDETDEVRMYHHLSPWFSATKIAGWSEFVYAKLRWMATFVASSP